jgi:hypothetical protein
MIQILELVALGVIGAVVDIRWSAAGHLGASVLAGYLKTLDPLRALLVLILVGIVLAVRAGIMLSSQSGSGGSDAVSYGLAGGAICPGCGRPFGLSMLSPHVFGYRLSHCPHCGKWSMLSRANPQDLLAAERRSAPEAHAPAPATDEAEALRRRIEDSRYE